ncbi:MAG: DUF1428 domain-containing protein [Pseudomonadota bacterium]
MTYIEGFVVPVPTANRDAYLQAAEKFVAMGREFGVARHTEWWGDDVAHGKVTDFYRAVDAGDGETVVFSWFEYPDKATRDAANAKMMADPRMAEMGKDMPFDGKRMIVGGFESIVDTGGARGGYVDGFVAPAPDRAAYLDMAAHAAPIFLEHGATRVVEGWEDDVSDGKVTDYRRAVQAQEGEKIVFSWIQWPDKATRDAGWAKVMADARMQPPETMPFDGKRMFWGGFTPILDK